VREPAERERAAGVQSRLVVHEQPLLAYLLDVDDA
jgi:hypothetical protein